MTTAVGRILSGRSALVALGGPLVGSSTFFAPNRSDLPNAIPFSRSLSSRVCQPGDANEISIQPNGSIFLIFLFLPQIVAKPDRRTFSEKRICQEHSASFGGGGGGEKRFGAQTKWRRGRRLSPPRPPHYLCKYHSISLVGFLVARSAGAQSAACRRLHRLPLSSDRAAARNPRAGQLDRRTDGRATSSERDTEAISHVRGGGLRAALECRSRPAIYYCCSLVIIIIAAAASDFAGLATSNIVASRPLSCPASQSSAG